MESIGRYLKGAREALGMSVEEISRATRIPVSSLEHIEADHFDDLPAEVFVRGFLRAYARAVQVHADDVLARYTASRRVSLTQIPLSAPQSRDSVRSASGRRVGVAIAFVLLLILFTVAISIVLRPRGQGAPRELSSGDASTRDHAAV